jgi:DNA-binding PadR family transcriptional regulator
MSDEMIHQKRLMILRLIADNDGKLGWYNVEIRIGMMSSLSVEPLPYAVLKTLEEDGYVRVERREGQSSGRYFITQQGIEFLDNETSD